MSTDANQPLLTCLQKNAIIDIQIGSGYYNRLLMLQAFLVADKTLEEMESAKVQIETRTIVDPWVKAYETLVMLTSNIEQCAAEQEKTVNLTAEEYSRLTVN